MLKDHMRGGPSKTAARDPQQHIPGSWSRLVRFCCPMPFPAVHQPYLLTVAPAGALI